MASVPRRPRAFLPRVLPATERGITLYRTVPYRTPDASREYEPPARGEPPELLGLGVHDAHYSVLYRTRDAIHAVDVAASSGRAQSLGCVVTRGRSAASVAEDAWAVFVDEGDALAVHTRHTQERTAARARGLGGHGDPHAGMLGFGLGGAPCVLLARPAGTEPAARGLVLSVRGTDLGTEQVPAWPAPPSSRALLAATTRAEGALAVLATDRDDEVDLSNSPAHAGDVPVSRTVSLGRAQRFECASGGGGRLVVVSRGPGGLVARTLARDLRSELNTVPLAPQTGLRVGRVRCVHAGVAFVVAHEERADDERAGPCAVVVTVFAGGAPTSVRAPLPRLDALVVDGADLVLAALRGGASGPQLLIYRVRLAVDSRGAPTRVFGPRRYAYVLEAPSCALPAERRALLADVADAVAVSLGARTPDGLSLRVEDDATDMATFAVRGREARNDARVELVARRDGSGGARVALGHDEPVVELHPPGLFARWFGVRCGEPTQAALELEFDQVSAAVGPIVAAVFSLRCAT